MSELLFWFMTAMTIGSALIVVLHSNLFYSALALVVTLFGVAAFYVFLWADFLAGVQVLIYIGGILILILFGIMLTNKISSVNISHSNDKAWPVYSVLSADYDSYRHLHRPM